ncbi:MAG: zinc ABC transporter solute-binding protein [Spirochaetales bacterium]|jgi:zinc transport system substrate-binding protein|nr:zinc ABC transporter solute-binding protein [Spirochaetales bacterium]
MKKDNFRLTALLLCVLFITACSSRKDNDTNWVSPDSDSSPYHLSVFVSIPPQAYFVRRVGGDRINVHVLVQDGKSPHTYEPTPRQVVALSEADVFFSIGVDYERAFLPRIESSLPDLLIVDTREGIQLRSIEEIHDTEEEDHDDMDPHIWLGFEEVKIQAAHMRDALSSLDPGGTEDYSRGFQMFSADIDRIATRTREALSSIRGKMLFVYHPTFGYFADTFGLIQRSVEIGGNAPSPRQIERIIDEARKEEAAAIIVQPQFSHAGADRIAEAVGASVVSVNPLSDNWIEMMTELTGAITGDQSEVISESHARDGG